MAASLDRELQEIVTLNITATDQGPGNNQANVNTEPKSILLFLLFDCLFGGWVGKEVECLREHSGDAVCKSKLNV